MRKLHIGKLRQILLSQQLGVEYHANIKRNRSAARAGNFGLNLDLVVVASAQLTKQPFSRIDQGADCSQLHGLRQ
jgi:hypothetical protein